MRNRSSLSVFCCPPPPGPSASFTASPSLTIYNQNFAVVREFVPMQLNTGVNQVNFEGITSFVEPSSVVLRDPSGRVHLSILEQNYRSDVASQYNLLRAYEGKELDFQYGAVGQNIHGRLIRAGANCGGNGCYGGSGEPIVEVDGRIEFGLPGKPIFPALQNEELLKPALNWLLQSDRAAQRGRRDQLHYRGPHVGGQLQRRRARERRRTGHYRMDHAEEPQRPHLRERAPATDGGRGEQDGTAVIRRHGQVDGGGGDQRGALGRGVWQRRRRPSTNITFTRWSARRRSRTARPSRSNSCAAPAFPPSGSMCTKAICCRNTCAATGSISFSSLISA